MEHIFVLAHKRGLRLGLPMYDGAMWHMPDGFDLAGFVADAHGVLEQWSMLGRSKMGEGSCSKIGLKTFQRISLI